MNRFIRYMLPAGVILAAVLGMAAVTGSEEDHEEARRLRDAGEVLPLAQILARVQAHHPGRVLEAELEREDGRLVYEIELLGPEGTVRELKVDAASGRVLEVGDD